MSSGYVSGWLQRRRFDVDAAALGLLVSIGLVPLRLIASDIYIETLPIVLGLACLTYLSVVRFDRDGEHAAVLPTALAGYLPGIVLAGVAGLVVIAVLSGGRTPLFYGVAGIVGTLLLLQILLTRDRAFNPTFLLVEIVLFAGAVRFGALYTSAGFIGIDIWTHQRFVESILSAGSLEAISQDKHYVAPLYHLLVATTAMLADVTPRTALYLTLGVAMPVSVVFVYSATKFVVSSRWAVFAAAAYAMGDYVIEWGLHIIPTSMGLIFFLGVVYALVRVMQTDYRTRDFLLLVLLTLAVIFTHQVSSFVMLVLLAGGIVAQVVLTRDLFRKSPLSSNIFGSMGPVNLVGLAVFDLGVLTFMWSFTPYRGNTFLETVSSLLIETVLSESGFLNLANPSSAPGGAAREPTFLEQVAAYVDVTGFLLLLLTTVLGSLYVLRRNRAKHAVYTLVAATAGMGIFVFGLPLFGVRNFIPQRWFAFTYVGMAVLSAVGVRYLSSRLTARAFLLVVLLFASAYPAAMVVSSDGAIDSPLFPNERARLSYTESEVAAVETIGSMTPPADAGGTLYTDHPYRTVFERTGAVDSRTAVIEDGRPPPHEALVYREYQSEGASFFLDGNERGEIRDVEAEFVCRPGSSTLYTNGPVRLCVDG